MIVDESFFGLARTGTIHEAFRYPGILKSSDRGHISLEDGILAVLGHETSSVPVENEGTEYNPMIAARINDDIVVIPDGAELIQRPRNLVERLHSIRQKYGYGRLIYLQGVADPYLIPILTYAGVSLFDDSTIRLESRNIRYTIFGRQLSEENAYSSNIEFVEGILETLQSSIKNGTLREIVEKYQISSKALELMRLLDNDAEGEMEEAFPRRTPYIKANSLESLRRPDLKRYRDYMANQYRKPEHRNIAFLMPCSARKPYSSSKSHRRVHEALGSLRKHIHEIIVTSPVGLVPREIEQTYPAAFYDIPVIGEWYEDEKVMIRSLIESYFSNNSYHMVVAFITEDLSFIGDSLPEGSRIIIWDKEKNNLNHLREELSEIVSEVGRTEKKVNVKMENFLKIAEYQFGSWIIPYLEGCRIVKSYNNDMLVINGRPVLVYNDKLGKFTINKASAPWFLEHGSSLVEIDNFKPTANIYAVGVLNATMDIRQEDEVVLHHKGEIRGVGTARMPYRAMLDLKKGVAVKVRN